MARADGRATRAAEASRPGQLDLELGLVLLELELDLELDLVGDARGEAQAALLQPDRVSGRQLVRDGAQPVGGLLAAHALLLLDLDDLHGDLLPVASQEIVAGRPRRGNGAATGVRSGVRPLFAPGTGWHDRGMPIDTLMV